MKVWAFYGDRFGVGNSRMIHPATAASAAGVDVELKDELPVIRARRQNTGDWVVLPDLERTHADVLVFQRPSDPELVHQVFPQLQAAGHAIVVDVDDDIAHVSWANLAGGSERPRVIADACRMADMVTVSTPALADVYGAHGRVAVLENCVPESVLALPRTSDGRTVGWAGWVGTHPFDLQVTYGGVADAVRRGDGRFRQIGPADGVRLALSLDEEPDATGGLDLPDYYRELGSLDVGVCPLAESRFNRAKSWLKPLEMTARGVAVVMSPRTEYARLADEGVGVLAADRGRNWRARVVDLLTDDALRLQVAERGMRIVAERHTYEGNAWRWGEVWETALANRRQHALRAAA